MSRANDDSMLFPTREGSSFGILTVCLFSHVHPEWPFVIRGAPEQTPAIRAFLSAYLKWVMALVYANSTNRFPWVKQGGP